MAKRLYGVRLFTGADGAGLPHLEQTLPEVRNKLDLPLRQGTEVDLVVAVELTAETLRLTGRSTDSKIERKGWPISAANPSFTAVVTAE